MRIIEEPKLDFDDVLIVPKRSNLNSRKEVNLVRELKHIKYAGIPIMAANMDGVGTFEMAEELSKQRCFTVLRKHYTIDQLVNWINETGFTIKYDWSMSIGITDDDIYKLDLVQRNLIYPNNMRYVCVDVANGYHEKFLDKVKEIRDFYLNDEQFLIAGNVATPEMTEALILAGVDVVKIGIGPGAFCETRKVTGVGYPQLSAIIECADAAHGLDRYIIGDGGCKTSGDVAKAFAAGADFVMLGTMLAGHDEGLPSDYFKSLGDWSVTKVIENGIPFYGMSSDKAMGKYGGKPHYRASEGKSGAVDYKGPVEYTIEEILGGLRSTCSYVGAKELKDLSKCATFVKKSK